MERTSGTGKGGKSFQDRELAAEVRSLALNKIKIILSRPTVEMNERDKDLHDEILKKLAGTVLPRLNEHTGEDGQAIAVLFDPAFSLREQSNATPPQTDADRE